MLVLIIIAVVFVSFAAILARYKRCPSDKILVIYGKTGKNKQGGASSARCIHGGASFIWPVFQSYSFLDLTPISIECNLTNALSKQNIRVDVPCRFTVGISTEPDNMTNAAERLLGLSIDDIRGIATDILFGQLRLVIATMDIEEINSDRDKFLANVSTNVEAELRKIGLKLINVNVTDIRDESGYIEALGKEAAAKAINDAKKSVAEQIREAKTVNQRREIIDKYTQTEGAKIAIKEGGLLGKGPGRSTQKYRVPLIFGDYMYSFLIEEYGLWMGILVLIMYVSLLARGSRIAMFCKKTFSRTAVAGLTLLISGQAMMHILINVGIVPVTGQTLPIVSDGKSSLLMFYIAFGVLLSISKTAKKQMDKAIEEARMASMERASTGDEVADTLSDVEELDNID